MTPKRSRRLIGALLSASLIAVVGQGAAIAHAELDTAIPADKATVQGSPSEIVMTFTEALKPANSSIKLVDAGNTVIVEGSTVDAADAKTMRLGIASDLAIGTYTVRWTSTSAADGDVAHGVTTFTVAAAPSPSPTSSATAAPSGTAPAGSPVAPSPGLPSIAPTAAASSPPTAPATSTSDAVIPIVVALVVLAALGAWLLRGRSRRAR